ncbi:hypothetical protein ABW19_dt0201086 [Dactylella cylindrospora]|nr:hypothetical protein ABW19_dt0201086 [Dactylella cylindrospora]
MAEATDGPDASGGLRRTRSNLRFSERKIDNFEARLVGIEGMLRDLTTSLKRNDVSTPISLDTAPPNYTSPSVADSSTICEDPTPDGEADPAFEGNSSMSAHTVFASEFLEKAVTSTSLGRQLNPDIQNALASLRQIVRMQNRGEFSCESRFVHQKQMPRGGFSQLPLPPTDVVLKLLREIKGRSRPQRASHK